MVATDISLVGQGLHLVLALTLHLPQRLAHGLRIDVELGSQSDLHGCAAKSIIRI